MVSEVLSNSIYSMILWSWHALVCNNPADLLGRTFTPLVKISNLAIYCLPLPGIPSLYLFLGGSLRDRKDITAPIQTLMQALHCTSRGGVFHCMLQVQYPVWGRKGTVAEQGSLPLYLQPGYYWQTIAPYIQWVSSVLVSLPSQDIPEQ